MTELWETFDLEAAPEVGTLDRTTYESRYRGVSPVVVRGGATGTAAFKRWDSDYLAATAGDAIVNVASYLADRRDYTSIRSERMSLADFLAGMGGGSGDEVRYLFNNASCIFVRNEERPEFQVGWAASPNLGLAPLAADFQVPEFIDPHLFVLAVIILGSQENATDLHYDHGGEGKVLVQLRGRKRLLLIPPTAAEPLRLNTLFRGADSPADRLGSRPGIDVHGPADQAAAADLDRGALRGYVAELAPGDIAYWPPFWFHDIANLDPFTLAAGIMVDEVRVPALLLRHLAHGVFRELLTAAQARAAAGSHASGNGDSRDPTGGGTKLTVSLGTEELGSMVDLFRDVEAELVREANRGTLQLWEWNERLGDG